MTTAMITACEECGHRGQWVISPMRERRGPDFGYLGAVDDLEPLETRVCSSCGYAVWSSLRIARSRQALARLKPMHDERTPCRGCGGERHYLLTQLLESTAGALLRHELLHVVQTEQEGEGRFAVLFCADCGRGQWFAWGTEKLVMPTRPGRSCAHCRGGDRRVVESVLENGGEPLPVAVQDGRPVGHFSLSFCSACGYCDWYARDLATLRADDERVMFVEGEPLRITRTPLAGGPYR